MNKSRTLLVILFFFVFFAALIAKLVDIQILRSEELKYYANKQQTNVQEIQAERGLIFDRNNILLVHNRNDLSFYVDLRMLPGSKKDELASIFSKTFGRNLSHYRKLLSQSGKTICFEKKAPSDKAFELVDYDLAALFYREDPTRIYQYGSLASHILGYVNHEYKGVNGIAKTFENELNGENGTRLIERNAIGELITIAEEETKSALAGDDIYLTIDKSYQCLLEEELKAGLQKYQGESAVGIIIDPNTGEILALANIQDFDPNRYWMFNDFQRKNRAITDSYEPGSTFKAVTIAALFEEETCKENDVINVEKGTYKYRNKFIHDTRKHNYLTVEGVIRESSNIGMAKLIQQLDEEIYYQYVRDFGFGNITSVSLPGEVGGKLWVPAEWSKFTKTYMSFGYGISVTPIQLVSAFCALINGGILYKPLILKKQVDKDGNLIKETSPVVVRRVISENTSRRVRNLLKNAVRNGTGTAAALDDIEVAGKTGTSKMIVNGTYSNQNYYSSFIGFFPAENPSLVCYVLVNDPKKEKYGSKVAAPIFKNIAERLIKDDPDRFLNNDRESFNKNDEDQKTLEDELRFVKVSKPPGNSLRRDTDITTVTAKNIMPDLKGYTIKEALKILNKLGINYSVNGSGVVIEQSVKPGSKITGKMVCKLSCSQVIVEGTRVY